MKVVGPGLFLCSHACSRHNFARNFLPCFSGFEIVSLKTCGFEPWLKTEQIKLRARFLGKVTVWLAVGMRIGCEDVDR